MKALLKLAVLGLIGYVAWNYFFPEGTGNRSPVIVSNGPVRIEATRDNRGTGEFKKGLFGWSRSWYHYHPGHSPSGFDVIVTDSSCGSEARYQATEMRILSTGNGTSSTVTIQIAGLGPLAYLEVDPDTDTKVTPDPRQPFRLDVGGRDDQLNNIRIAGSSCAFIPGQGTVTIYQTYQK